MNENASTLDPVERRLAALILAVNRVNTLQPLDDLLMAVAQEGARALQAERCTVWLADEGREELYARVAMGVEKGRPLRMSKYEGIAGDTLRTGRPSNVPDAAADPRFNPAIGQSSVFRTRNVLSVPMFSRDGRPFGVFQALNKADGGQFTSDDERLAEAFASTASVVIQNAREFQSVKHRSALLDEENARLRLSLADSFSPCEFVGASPELLQAVETARRVSDTDISLLITGESGSGKTLLAKCIHYQSPRRNRPFVEVNCAAIPETLLEAELFGIEKGIATGVDRRVGKLEAANGGTVFLDEIGDLSLSTQAKMLRVVQEKSFERVGSHETLRADVRIISATHRDLASEIAARRFREDLYYRLNVVTVHLPPLRERREDIPALATQMLERLGKRFGRPARRFVGQALSCLQAYDWPGNVRELENEISRSLVLAGDREELAVEDLSEKLQQVAPAASVAPSRANGRLAEQVEILERRLIDEARRAAGGNKTKMARLLGLSREGLRKKLARYRIT